MNLRILKVSPLMLLAAALVGCGGGHGGSSSGVAGLAGHATFKIKWPTKTRVVPLAANAIVFTLTKAGETTIVSPPIDRTTLSWTSPSITTGDWNVAAQAFPNADGTGNAQAAGSTVATVTSSGSTNVDIALGSTVSTVTVTGLNTVAAGSSIPLAASCKDSTGSVVLVDPTTVTWTTSTPTKSRVITLPTGLASSVTGLAVGSATVTATFSEVEATLGQTPVSGSSTITVTADPNPTATNVTAQFGVDLRNTFDLSHSVGIGQKWRLPLTSLVGSGTVGSPVVASDGIVFVADNQSNLYAVSPTKQAAIWTTAGVKGTKLLAAPNYIVYAASPSGIEAYDAGSGLKIWGINTPVTGTGDDCCYPIIGTDGFLYWAADSTVYKIDTTLQKTVATFNMDPFNGAPGTVAQSLAIFGTKLYVPNQIGRLYSLNTTDLSENWVFLNNLTSVTANPGGVSVDSTGVVYIGASSGIFHAINPATGAEIWHYGAAAPILQTASVSADEPGVVYVADSGGNVAEVYKGNQLWTYSIGGSPLPTLVLPTVAAAPGANDGPFRYYIVGNQNGHIAFLAETRLAGTITITNPPGATFDTFSGASPSWASSGSTLYIMDKINSLYAL